MGKKHYIQVVLDEDNERDVIDFVKENKISGKQTKEIMRLFIGLSKFYKTTNTMDILVKSVCNHNLESGDEKPELEQEIERSQEKKMANKERWKNQFMNF